MSTREFRLMVHYESDHIWAEVEELPGCFASGADMEELREALEEALTLYLSDQPGDCKVTIMNLVPQSQPKRLSVRAQLLAA